MLYLYAITEDPRAPDERGLHGAPLRSIGEHRLFAIASEHAEKPADAGVDDLWAHEAVVEAAMKLGSVLPVRFGTTLLDELAVGALLRRRRVELKDALARVRDRVELGVRALAPPAETPAATPDRDVGPGTAYMLGRLEEQRRAAAAAARIHEPLAALACESVRNAKAAPAAGLNVAYLVDRDRVDAFRARVEELAESHHAAVVCTGPWPPYSFTAEAAE